MSALLEGLRIVEVASFVFAPAAGTILSDFGAEVIHVEPPGAGDPYRQLSKMQPLPKCDENYCWILDSRNKKSIVLDLKRSEGHEVLCDILATSDVVITNYQCSVLSELNITYEELHKVNPRLIYAHATGYGTSGEELEKPGYDATAWWARSGMMDAVRPFEGELGLSTAGMGDHPSSLSVVAAILLGLLARERTGEGAKVSTSLMGNGAWANSILIQAALCGGSGYRPPTQIDTPNAMVNHYQTEDGRSFFLALVKEASDWESFCNAIGRLDLITDTRFETLDNRRNNSKELAAILTTIFKQRTLREWCKILDKHSVTFGIVARSEDAPNDPQMEANDIFRNVVGLSGTRIVDSPIEVSGFQKVAPKPPPKLGEHTHELLLDLGYESSKVDRLEKEGIVGSNV